MNDPYKLHLGDNVTVMKDLPDSLVDLTVTSPPYDSLREYKGFSWDFETLSSELFRVTKDGGIVVWVVGDATINGSESLTSFKQAIHFVDKVGFRLHDTMIYKKNNYMPLNHNRYDPEFEYMFVFSKGKPKTFNPLMIPCKTAGEIYNHANRSSASIREKSCAVRRTDGDRVTNEFKYRGNVWGYDTGKNKGSKDDIWEHPATFPELLAHDHIVSWSNPDDVVFDPFMGSGTTGKMAVLAGRKFIGIELSEEYMWIAEKRLINAYNEFDKAKRMEELFVD